jgi:hypothetical protein
VAENVTEWLPIRSGTWSVEFASCSTTIVAASEQFFSGGVDYTLQLASARLGVTVETMPDGQSTVLDGEIQRIRSGVSLTHLNLEEYAAKPSLFRSDSKSPITVVEPKTKGIPLLQRTLTVNEGDTFDLSGLQPGWWWLVQDGVGIFVNCATGRRLALTGVAASENIRIEPKAAVKWVETFTITPADPNVVVRQFVSAEQGTLNLKNVAGRTLTLGKLRGHSVVVLNNSIATIGESLGRVQLNRVEASSKLRVERIRIVPGVHGKPLTEFGGQAPVLYKGRTDGLKDVLIGLGDGLQPLCITETPTEVRCAPLSKSSTGSWVIDN